MPEQLPKKAEVKRDIQAYGSLEVLAKTEGGRILLEDAKMEALQAIDTLCDTYAASSHFELVALISTLKERLTLLRKFTRAAVNEADALKVLEDILEKEKKDLLDAGEVEPETN